MDQERPPILYKFKPCIELDLIDCNCTNCIHMVRDMERYQKWEANAREYQQSEFDKDKKKALDVANAHPDEKSKKSLLFIANKMTFQFSREGLLNYGHCSKFDKPVSFLPNTCQIETQECFKHRRL